MALKRQYRDLAAFSMSSMTDVIFLLLIFFMVTSSLVFPSAIEVQLPQSGEQTSERPVTEVYVSADSTLYIVIDRNDSVASNAMPQRVTAEELMTALGEVRRNDSTRAVALYADVEIPYGKVVEVLDMAATQDIKMVLATRASQTARTKLVNTPVAPAAGKQL